MGPLFGLGAAGLWGVGDFSGGMAVKHARGGVGAALRVVLLSHATSLGVLLAIALAMGDPFPHGRVLGWGIAAGVFGGLSLTAFYIALSRGEMGASAAVSGVLAAAIPAVVAGLVEGAAGWRRVVGFCVAGVAIWMIAGAKGEKEASTGWLAVGAGAGFGMYFVALKYAGAGGLVWPMTTARMGSISTCLLILLALRGAGTVKVTADVWKWVVGAALFDTTGNLMFVAATRAGRLDVAAVLSSLYPASTILLAGVLLKEKMTGRQGWGMAVAVGAVVLIVM